MSSVPGGRRLALPAIEERRLRQALLAHYRAEKNARGQTGQYPNMILQDLRPLWRSIAGCVVPTGPCPLGLSEGLIREGLVDYGDLVARADNQVWDEEEDGGPPRDGELVAYLDRLRGAVAGMGLYLHGEPAGWALAEVHADVRGYPLYYGTMQSWEEATIKIYASPTYASVTAFDRAGEQVGGQEIEPREPFAFDEWDALASASHAVLDDQLARVRAAFFEDRARFPRVNRANKTRSPKTVKALYDCLRLGTRYDKATTDLARELAKEIGLDFSPRKGASKQRPKKGHILTQ